MDMGISSPHEPTAGSDRIQQNEAEDNRGRGLMLEIVEDRKSD